MDTTPTPSPTLPPATPSDTSPTVSPKGTVSVREFLTTTGYSILVAVAPLALQALTTVVRHGLDGEFAPNTAGVSAAALLFVSTFAGLIARKFGQGPTAETPPPSE